MGQTCLLCRKGYKQKVHLFGFPKDKQYLEKWCDVVKVVRTKWVYTPGKKEKICSEHFLKSDIYDCGHFYRELGMDDAPKRITLNPTAIPSAPVVGLKLPPAIPSVVDLQFPPAETVFQTPTIIYISHGAPTDTLSCLNGGGTSEMEHLTPDVKEFPCHPSLVPLQPSIDKPVEPPVKTPNGKKTVSRLTQTAKKEVREKSTQVHLTKHPLCDGSIMGKNPLCEEHKIAAIFEDAIKCVEQFKDLTFTFHSWTGGEPTHIEVTRIGWYNQPCLGQSPCKVILSRDGEVHFIISFSTAAFHENMTTENGKLDKVKFSEMLLKLSAEGRYLWCSGMSLDNKDTISGTVHYQYPCPRLQASCCAVFFKASANTQAINVVQGIRQCSECRTKERIVCSKRLVNEKPSKINSSAAICPISEKKVQNGRDTVEQVNLSSERTEQNLEENSCVMQDESKPVIRKRKIGCWPNSKRNSFSSGVKLETILEVLLLF